MKKILLLFLLSGCSIDRLADRMELPSNQVWDLYTALHVIKVDRRKHYQQITAIPYGKPYPKYSYQWHDYSRGVSVGDIIPLTDSLRSHIDYAHNWKKYPAK
jgi:hypothetical protein